MAIQEQNIFMTETGISGVIGDGTNVISTGVAIGVEVPHDMLLTSVRIMAIDGLTGSIKIDIWKDTYSNGAPTDADTITGANEPEISSGTKDEDTTLTSWTKTLSKGDWLIFNVDSVSTFKKVAISLIGDKT